MNKKNSWINFRLTVAQKEKMRQLANDANLSMTDIFISLLEGVQLDLKAKKA